MKHLTFTKQDHLIFISDTHLHEENFADLTNYLKKITQELNTLKPQAPASIHIFLIGDIFDAFIGSDSLTFFAWFEFLDFFKTTQYKGYFIRGNRDFLMKEPDFNHLLEVLDDEMIISIKSDEIIENNTHFLVAHGDQWCTQDIEYMKFRQLVRQPAWQEMVLAKPLVERQMMAVQIRNKSETIKNAKGEYEDIHLDALNTCIDDIHKTHNIKITTVIHGHTHAGKKYIHDDDYRFVLSSWENQKSLIHVHERKTTLMLDR